MTFGTMTSLSAEACRSLKVERLRAVIGLDWALLESALGFFRAIEAVIAMRELLTREGDMTRRLMYIHASPNRQLEMLAPTYIPSVTGQTQASNAEVG